MRTDFFRAFGVLTIFLGCPAVLATLPRARIEYEYRIYYLIPAPRTVFLLAAVIVLGCGLAYLRKWAALYFSIPLFGFGIWQVLTSIESVSFPGNLLVMAHGLSLTLPLIVTILIWKQLTWGGRFF